MQIIIRKLLIRKMHEALRNTCLSSKVYLKDIKYVKKGVFCSPYTRYKYTNYLKPPVLFTRKPCNFVAKSVWIDMTFDILFLLQTPQDLFVIEENQGNVTLNGPLDYEVTTFYQLEILAIVSTCIKM